MAGSVLAFLSLPEVQPSWGWVGVGWLLHLFCFILVTLHALRSRREPASTLLWIFVGWSVPFIGPLTYIAFGVDRVQDKGFAKGITDEAFLKERRIRQRDALPLAYWNAVRTEEAIVTDPDALVHRLNKAMDVILPEYPLLKGNRIVPLVEGNEAFPRMLKAIRKATNHIHLQSFIIRNDAIGTALMDALKEKAQQGVVVRLLVDRFGSTQAFMTGFFRRYRNVPNLQIYGWTQANPLKRQFQINLRNHRKILVIDGTVAFCGGINFHSENVTRSPDEPAIRDYHFELTGPIVQQLQYSFLRDWFFITDDDVCLLLKDDHFPTIEAQGPVAARVLNSGPTSEMGAIADVVFSAITSATKQVIIVTPYFAPPPDIVRALRSAALRGVDVRLITPGKNNHVYAGLAGRAFYKDLLESGVRIFHRRPPFMHAKAMLVDDSCAIIGTANWDIRSLSLNYETDIVALDEDVCDQIKRIVLVDEAQSDEINLNEWVARPEWKKMLENLAFLMTPVL